MFDHVITAESQVIIDFLSRWPPITNFYLAGGTGASIQIGHRVSYDLDFFPQTEFLHENLSHSLKTLGHFVIGYSDLNTLVGRINETKIGFLHYPYELLKPPHVWRGLKVASLEDIACNKLDAISSHGKKRDFVDLYFTMQALNLDLNQLFQFFEKKYGREQYNLIHIQKSLVFFKEAEGDPEPHLLVDFSWEECKAFFVRQIEALTI